MAQPQSSPPPQPLSRGWSIILWIGIVVFLAIVLLGIYAIVTKLSIVISVISFVLATLALIGIPQVAPHILLQAWRSIKTGLLVVGITVLIGSLTMNVYLFICLQTSQTPHANTPSPTKSMLTMTPTQANLTSTPTGTSSTKPALVQKNFFISSQSTASNMVTFPLRVAAGDLIVVAITDFLSPTSIVTDNHGNTYLPVGAVQHANTSTDYVQLYYAKNVTGGLTTITSTGGGNIGIYEYSGLDPASPLDQVTSSQGFGNAPNGGTVTTTRDNELYFAVGVDDNGGNTVLSPGNGYSLESSELDSTHHERFYTEDRIAAHGSYPTDFTIAVSSHWAVIGASFKPLGTPTSFSPARGPKIIFYEEHGSIGGVSFQRSVLHRSNQLWFTQEARTDIMPPLHEG